MQSLEAVKEQKKEKQVTVSDIVKRPMMVNRFADVLGSQDKANQFLASLVSAVNGNYKLAKCNPMSVVACAMIAASLNLDINPNLGFASIVPYKHKFKDANGQWCEEQVPQFQMGWKGFVQLAMRTGKYRTMNVTEVYADEYDGYDPFKGELKYHLVTGGDRDNDRKENIVGYVFYFALVSGFEKMSYMSKAEAEAHARRFSMAYQYDLKNGTQSSTWTTAFDAMAEKTVTKLTLSKWGVLSTQMVEAQRSDQIAVNSSDGLDITDADYIDNPIIEQVEEQPKIDAPKQAEQPKAETKKESKAEKKSEKKEEAKAEGAPELTGGPESFEDSPFGDNGELTF